MKTSTWDIVSSFLSNFLNLGMNIIILPFALIWLSPFEQGIWHNIIIMISIVGALELTFSPNITRYIALAYIGSKEVVKEGFCEVNGVKTINYSLLKATRLAGQKIHFLLGLIIAFCISILFFLYSVHTNNNLLLVGFCLSLGIFINIYATNNSAVLKGIEKIMPANVAMIISRIAYIFIAIGGLWLTKSLIWISLALIVSGLLLFGITEYLIMKQTKAAFKSLVVDVKKIFKVILPSSINLIILTIGGFLITKSTVFICTAILGAEEVAPFGLSLQLLNIVGSAGMFLIVVYIPELTTLAATKNLEKIRKVLAFCYVYLLVVTISGVLAVIIIVPPILSYLEINAQLLPFGVLLIYGLIDLLEWNHSFFTTFITTKNKVPFVKATIFTSFGIMILATFLLKTTSLGVLAAILAQGILQLAYNNWYWVRYATKDLEINFIQLASIGVKQQWHKLRGTYER